MLAFWVRRSQPRIHKEDPALEHFLAEDESQSPLQWDSTTRGKNYRIIAIPWFLCAILSIALLYLVKTGRQQICLAAPTLDDMTYSPVNHLLESQNVVFTGGFGTDQTLYQGPSSPERDKAWDELYNFDISRIPKSEAVKLVNKTVLIPGDPGHYVVSLNVFHQLHCVNA
ncbi:hypothetical protein HGRIS_007866 [Hohenbuehelia grisea]|uniref:Uncharacterized protein n=1 Tax=Hohenbuehelia grisea TaxID=104357 RepID=A0ABR3J670_9AGAR